MCHSNIVSRLYFVIITLLVSACNDDVFVDRPDLAGDVAVELEGYCLEQIPYSTRDLEEILICHGELCDNIIYDSAGNQRETVRDTYVSLEPGSASRVAIAGRSVTLTMDLSVNGIVELYAGDNYSKEPFTAQVILRYRTFRRIIDVTVKPGEPFNVMYYEYAPVDEAQVRVVESEVGSVTYNNNSGSILTVGIRPYRNVVSTVDIDIRDGVDDMLDFDSAPPVWLLTADYLGQLAFYGEVPLMHGRQNIPYDQRELVEETYAIPPYSSYRFTVRVKIAKVTSEFAIIAVNPLLTTRFEAGMTVVEPVDYQIEYERID